MNRAQQVLAMSPEDRYKTQCRVMYRLLRRQGHTRQQAMAQTVNRVARLVGAATVMDASCWKANPVSVALIAAQH
ncbi:hypothetical protein [Comamonas guangdongensis]|uniref:Uncharacterized protein n=1 Tax=Comamonas guangdongensis TaxID=510515 RepID=A0ABV3ZPN8_9BURK